MAWGSYIKRYTQLKGKMWSIMCLEDLSDTYKEQEQVLLLCLFLSVCARSGRNDKDLISNRINVKETIKHN